MTEKVEKPRRRRGKKGKEVQKNLKTFTSTSNSTNTIDLKLDSNRFKFREHQSLLLILDEDAQYWYDIGQNIKDRNATIYNSSEMKESSSSSHSKMNKPKLVPAEIASSYRSLADKIYQHEINLYNVQYSSTSDDKWVENTMRKGTLKDRVAAMSVTASQTPVHKMRAGLDQLLHLATQAKTSSQQQRVNQLAGEALVDLFTETYLPSDRKLYSLSSRPLMKYYNNNNETLSPRVLLLWYFEELIKEKYSSFLNLLTKWCSTENGGGSTSSGSNLIYMNNMTGSSSELQKIMAIKTAAHLLSQRPEGEERLLSMIVNKIGDPHKKTAAASGHALRNVLDQHPVMIHVIAREVMQLAHRPHLSSKALYNCIVFLNQLKLKNSSEKYTTLASDLVQTYFQLFEVAVNQHQQDDNSSKKKLNVKNDTPGIVMNSRLLSALLTGVNRAHPFLPPSESLQDKKRIDALYRIAHMTSSPGTATQALTLLYHLAIGVNEDDDESNQQDKVKKDLDTKVSSSSRKDRFYRVLYSSLSSHTMVCRGGTKHHLTLFFNLLYKSMKRDVIPLRVLAFGKRLLHTVMHAIENSCGVKSASIFLLSEVARYQPILKNFHLTTMDNCEFNPAKRDPCVAFGDKEKKCHHLWEIQMISQHFHPSVRKFAQNFMDNDRGNVIDYGGDPLRDFSLTSFLDRVAYRHPKTRQKKDVDEGIEDEQASSHIGIRKKNMVVSTAVPVNDEKFWNGLGKKVSVENEFFQKYFVERARRDKAKGIERNSDVKLDPEMDLDKLILENEKKEDDIHKKLDEDGWETDSEEEAFANELAEKLMESAGNGKANFDNEDPDMDGWNELYSDSDDDSAEDIEKETENNNFDFTEMDGIERRDKKNVNKSSSSNDIDVGEHDDDACMDDGSDSNDDDVHSESEEDDEFMGMIMDDDVVDDDDFESETDKNKENKSKKKKTKLSSAFEDADQYTELISKDWADRDEVISSLKDETQNDKINKIDKKEMSIPQQSNKRKDKKRRKTKK